MTIGRKSPAAQATGQLHVPPIPALCHLRAARDPGHGVHGLAHQFSLPAVARDSAHPTSPPPLQTGSGDPHRPCRPGVVIPPPLQTGSGDPHRPCRPGVVISPTKPYFTLTVHMAALPMSGCLPPFLHAGITPCMAPDPPPNNNNNNNNNTTIHTSRDSGALHILHHKRQYYTATLQHWLHRSVRMQQQATGYDRMPPP